MVKNVRDFLKAMALGFFTVSILDYLWLGLLMRSFYLARLGSLLNMQGGVVHLCWPAGIVVWFLLIFGLIIFVHNHALAISATQQGMLGALYGFIIYSVYGLTNYAILTQWPLSIVIVDSAWGTCVYGLTALLLYCFIE